MRIVHFSDWHGDWHMLPKADLYICTGDMLDNYPDFDDYDAPPLKNDILAFVDGVRRKIVPEKEAKEQTKWLKQEEPLRRWFASETAPVVLVRGNHCFTDYGKYFDGEYFEVTEDSSRFIEYCGLKIGGIRGIPYIEGEWSDELNEGDLQTRINQLPDDLDILVTHTPPHGILDLYFAGRGGIGSTAVRSYINRQLYSEGPLKLHLFGHAHRDGGQTETHGNIQFVNAAKTHVVIDL